jgi:phospholipid/cholesterol/gamma-HCH transport system substrate-binding protein
MEARREQAAVGVFVIIAAGLLVATVFALTGALSRSGLEYHAYFKFAAGLAPGAIVRYAGGPQVGRIEEVRTDPSDPARMKITFRVKPETPVKTDSVAKIASLSPLGDNFLEIVPGSPKSPVAPSGSTLSSVEYTSFQDVTDLLNQLGPSAQDLLKNLNARITELQETIVRANDLMNQQNRANLSASLGNIRGMLEEDRPKIKSTLGNVDAASAKLAPLLNDFKKTLAQANDALAHLDATLQENRPDLRKSIAEMRDALASAQSLTDQLNRLMNTNSENLDEILENMRHVSENLKEFTDTIKTRPYTLIRSSSPTPRKPGGTGKP